MEKKERLGLWSEVVESIELLAKTGCYEKVNRYMSLGLVDKLREKTIRLLGKPETVLDAGCGPGTSTHKIRQMLPESKIIALDPSTAMLRMAQEKIDGIGQAVAGLFEKMPLRENSIDAATAMFSFRDAVDFEQALSEFSRVLKPGGKLAILDIYRPEGPAILLVELYFRIFVPIAVFLSRCSKYLGKYTDFLETIHSMLTIKDLRRLLGKYFSTYRIKRYAPGLAIIYAEK